jgi:hypothetical protein
MTFRVALGVVGATPHVVTGVPDLGSGRIADIGDVVLEAVTVSLAGRLSDFIGACSENLLGGIHQIEPPLWMRPVFAAVSPG